jgi:hypothetical protein
MNVSMTPVASSRTNRLKDLGSRMAGSVLVRLSVFVVILARNLLPHAPSYLAWSSRPLKFRMAFALGAAALPPASAAVFRAAVPAATIVAPLGGAAVAAFTAAARVVTAGATAGLSDAWASLAAFAVVPMVESVELASAIAFITAVSTARTATMIASCLAFSSASSFAIRLSTSPLFAGFAASTRS